MRGEMSGTDVPIKELPPYLPKAFIAIEDRRFYSHFGVDPIGLGARRRRQRAPPRRVAGRLDHHPAARQEPVPDPGAHALAQDAGTGAGALARAQVQQGGDSRALSQPRLFRLRRLRGRGGGAALFRQVRAPGEGGRGRDAGRPGEIAVAAGAEPQSRRRRAPRADRARGHDRARLRHRDHGQDRARAARARGEAGGRRLRQLRRRLDHGRARRSGRPRRAGPRGRDLDRSGPAGGGREGAGRRACAQRAESSTSPRAPSSR